MTIWNEAARLFFALSALILVGLLSAPLTGTQELHQADMRKVSELKVKSTLKTADRKPTRKVSLKKS